MKATKPQEIQEMLRVRFAETVSYLQAHRCRSRLLDKDIGTSWRSFQLLPAYRDRL
jgi:hypothetical protein